MMIAEIITGTFFAPLGFVWGTAAILLGHLIGCVLLFFAGYIGGIAKKSAMETTKYSFGSPAYALPMRVVAGGSYRLAPAEKHAFTLGADLGYILPQEYKAFTAAVGAEYAFSEMVFARAGYHFSSAVAPRYAAFGLGFSFKGIGLDAAYLLGQAANAWTLTLKVCL